MASSRKPPAGKGGKSPARSGKIARVWCLARDLGIDGNNKELLYAVVESVTGKDSISVLGISEINAVIETLQGQVLRQKRQKYLENMKRQDDGVSYLPTPQQRDVVDDLLKKLTPLLILKKPDAYLEAICKRTYRREYKRLNKTQIQGLIEALKSIYKRHLGG